MWGCIGFTHAHTLCYQLYSSLLIYRFWSNLTQVTVYLLHLAVPNPPTVSWWSAGKWHVGFWTWVGCGLVLYVQWICVNLLSSMLWFSWGEAISQILDLGFFVFSICRQPRFVIAQDPDLNNHRCFPICENREYKTMQKVKRTWGIIQSDIQ